MNDISKDIKVYYMGRIYLFYMWLVIYYRYC